MILARRRARRRTRALLAACVIAALAMRLALLLAADWRYDYDEGMVGLQARHILAGARPIFHPGQPYLGALESYAIAGLFALAGSGAVTLKLIPWLLAGAYTGITGWLGWRVFGARAGALSGLLAALAPAYLLVTGTKAWGATAETLVLGGLLLALTTRALDDCLTARQRERALVAAAFVGGIAFWVSWLIAFYAVPAGLALLLYGRDRLRRRGIAAALAFLAGSLPFWAYNLTHDFATFAYLLSDQGDTWANAAAVIDHLNYDLAPRMVSGDPAWRILSWPAIWWLQIVYEGGLVALIWFAWRGRRHDPGRALLGVFALGLPAIYLVSGYGNHALNAFGFDATGRYILMIHSVLPIGVAALADELSRHGRRFVAAAIVASAIALNLLGAARLDPTPAFVSPYYTRQPASLDPLIDYLDQASIRHVWTDVGIAHVLMFQTDGRILAADWYDIYGAKGIVRFPEVPPAIAAAERVAFVEVTLPGQRDTRFEQAFAASGVPYTVARPAPDLIVIVPGAPIDPATLGDGLGYQF